MYLFPSPNNIIFPFYHTISDGECPHIKNLYPVKSSKQFEKELDYFQKNFHTISLEEIQSHIKNKTQPKKPSFFLSFDDGLKGCFTTIAPILKTRNLTAAFFLNTDFVDNQALFYRYKVSLIIEKIRLQNLEFRISNSELLKLAYGNIDQIDEIAHELNVNFDEFLKKEKPYMGWDEIENLYEQGFCIGGHSVSHPYFSQISQQEQIFQTQRSVDIVQEKLNLNYRIFSFPFTDAGITKSYFETIYKEKICELTFGTAGIKKDEFSQNLQRIPMDNCLNSPEKFIQKQILQYQLKTLLKIDIVKHPK